MNVDWPELARAAKRAQLAYIISAAEAKSAFEAIGHTFVSQYQDSDSQAVLSVQGSRTYLSISGTRFSAGKIGDLIDDLETDALDLGGGAKVTRGPYESAQQIWTWALNVAPAGTVFDVCGHSLGGWRTSYTPLFIPKAQIGTLHCFEPPKGANAAYYARYADELAGMVIVGNGRDIWFGYPRRGDWIHKPGPMVWLTSTGFNIIDTRDWPGGLNLADHSIDTVFGRADAIACSQVQKGTAAPSAPLSRMA